IFNRALNASEVQSIFDAGSSGKCKEPEVCEGEDAPCDDHNACTESDACHEGTCVGTPVDCEGGQCRNAGTCNPLTGNCSGSVMEDGSECNDGDPCTESDECTDGSCGGTLITCD